MKAGRPNLEFGATKRLRGQDALRLSPVGFHYQLAALHLSGKASASTSRLVRPLTPPPQRDQFHLYALVSKFQRFSQNKTARFLARVPGRLDRGRAPYAGCLCSHITMWLSSLISCSRLPVPERKMGENQIQALTATVNLVRGVRKHVGDKQGYLAH